MQLQCPNLLITGISLFLKGFNIISKLTLNQNSSITGKGRKESKDKNRRKMKDMKFYDRNGGITQHNNS
jgi:hypothetical protein